MVSISRIYDNKMQFTLKKILHVCQSCAHSGTFSNIENNFKASKQTSQLYIIKMWRFGNGMLKRHRLVPSMSGLTTFVPRHDKTNHMSTPSEDSDQPCWFCHVAVHLCLASHFWDLSKQCRPRSDASDRSLHFLHREIYIKINRNE